ncbi:single-stranded DNA-binding protein [Candidatus Peregrinibacteria bacterium CG_4_10_14_0_2_um_filter_38_24]|nr:MAG: single-stranded DNA-binding protein [Candidatus Peregrinibacteria bacterium CG_4_10_14_0_2_um_filter_38_24]PJC38513.1 MAG: single-stranded DNA-binding protein [Candidatus Peregrinibacteria bacterium CG_4_9_14_0_2_um_filter_38_9]
MAMSLNRVQLIGNLTRDPDVKQIPSGQTVATFSVATNFSWNDSSGTRQNKTEFHNIVAWRKLAEICGQYLKKGAKVFVEGKLQTRDWQGEDGVKRYRTEIVADNMIMLGGKGDGGSAYGADREAAGISGGASSDFVESEPAGDFAPVSADEEVKIDDLPF